MADKHTAWSAIPTPVLKHPLPKSGKQIDEMRDNLRNGEEECVEQLSRYPKAKKDY